jgi:hypothetical protein
MPTKETKLVASIGFSQIRYKNTSITNRYTLFTPRPQYFVLPLRRSGDAWPQCCMASSDAVYNIVAQFRDAIGTTFPLLVFCLAGPTPVVMMHISLLCIQQF